MSEKIAFITGITGQDGAYLADFLLSRGYIVHGVKRRSSLLNTERIDYLYRDRHDAAARLFLHYGDMTDSTNLLRLLGEVKPNEVYNLAAQSHVKVSFETPEYTANPYAVAKLYAYWITVNYREAYGMHASNGILFNHESPIRGETFVTRKITRAVASIKHGLQDRVYLGNLDAQRDWGHARDYVEGMCRILQQDDADDYGLETGESHSVREFVEKAFAHIGRTIEWRGSGTQEKGVDKATGQVLVEIDPRYFRPTEV